MSLFVINTSRERRRQVWPLKTQRVPCSWSSVSLSLLKFSKASFMEHTDIGARRRRRRRRSWLYKLMYQKVKFHLDEIITVGTVHGFSPVNSFWLTFQAVGEKWQVWFSSSLCQGSSTVIIMNKSITFNILLSLWFSVTVLSCYGNKKLLSQSHIYLASDLII